MAGWLARKDDGGIVYDVGVVLHHRHSLHLTPIYIYVVVH